jgi:tellurite resistance protein TerA
MADRKRPTGDVGGGRFARVSLTAAEPSASLTRMGAASGTLRVNLRWSSAPMAIPGIRAAEAPGRRFFAPRRLEATPTTYAREIDLDLGCFYEFGTGEKGVIQAMGNRRGVFDRPPYIRLDHDDRSGSSSGENLFINLDHADRFRRILIFAYIYSGAPTFDQANAVVTLFPSSGPAIEIRLDSQTAQARSCAVSLIAYAGGDLLVRREVKYVAGYQSEIDGLYGWGLRWAEGAKQGLS